MDKIKEAKRVGQNRYSVKSLNAFILDVLTLAHSDYAVCTLSSNVGRLVYELMHGIRPDAYKSYKSLDLEYYFYGYNSFYRVAIYDHTPMSPDELELKKGDIIKFTFQSALRNYDGNLWNGYSRGYNMRTGKKGIFPTFKAKFHYSNEPY